MIVLDASALVIALTDVTDRGRTVRNRLHGVASARSPDLVNCETLSSLSKLRQTGSISPAGHRQAVAGLLGIAVARVPTTAFIERITELTDNVTPYDAAYVALAESLDCPILTGDRRLAQAPGPRCDFEVV